MFRYYRSQIELPFVLDTWFKFRYLTLNLFTDIVSDESLAFYVGLGGSLVTLNADKDFISITESIFVPELALGGEYFLSRNYSVFTELSFQTGSVNIDLDESLSLMGIRFIIGVTMYLLNQEGK